MTPSYVWHVHECPTTSVCDMTHSHVWHDAFTCVTWLIHMCETTHSHVWQWALMSALRHLVDVCTVWQDSFICTNFFCFDMTHSYACHLSPWVPCDKSLRYVLFDMTHLYVDLTYSYVSWHDSFICAHLSALHMCSSKCPMLTWLIHMLTWRIHMRHGMTRSYVLIWVPCGIWLRYVLFDMTYLYVNMTHSYVPWHDSFMCAHLIALCSHDSFICEHDSFICAHWSALCEHDSFICVITWLIYMCSPDCRATSRWGMYSLTWLIDILTWLIHMCDMSRPWRIHMCDMTHSYAWHDSFICVTWLIHMRDVTHSCVTHDSFICVTWLIDTRSIGWPTTSISGMSCVTWLIHMYTMTRSYVRHDLSMTYSHMWRDSFICETWLTATSSWDSVWFSRVSSRICLTYDRLHSKCYSPEIHQIQKLKFLGTNSNQTQTQFESVPSLICVTLCIHMFDITHPYACSDSFTYVPFPNLRWNFRMTHSLCNDKFITHTTFRMTHSLCNSTRFHQRCSPLLWLCVCVCVRVWECVCVHALACVFECVCVCVFSSARDWMCPLRLDLNKFIRHTPLQNYAVYIMLFVATGRRYEGCFKLQVSFRKRATNYRALLRKDIFNDKASYVFLLPCSSVALSILKNDEIHVSMRYVDLHSETDNIYMCIFWHPTYLSTARLQICWDHRCM